MKGQEFSRVQILKFDPSVDKEPRHVTYKAPYRSLTVLQVLKYIYEKIDPTLCFRIGCGGTNQVRCGACALLVNGKPVLSCQKTAEKKMIVGPHPKFKVIKDLVTDLKRKRQEGTKRESRVEIIVDPVKCMGCRDCVSICPMGVWEVKKVGRELTAVPVDMESCCGSTCMQCVMFCRFNAITVID